jgi:hypothetical protein
VVHGLLYLAPNQALRGYAWTFGLQNCAIIISFPLGEKSSFTQILLGNVAGLAYFVPKPTPTVRGYACM